MKREKKPHKHAELIKAWADGAQIEQKWYGDYWDTCDRPDWDEHSQYRLKPEPAKELVLYATVTFTGNGGYDEESDELIDDLEICSCENVMGSTNLILVFDADTKELNFARIYE